MSEDRFDKNAAELQIDDLNKAESSQELHLFLVFSLLIAPYTSLMHTIVLLNVITNPYKIIFRKCVVA